MRIATMTCGRLFVALAAGMSILSAHADDLLFPNSDFEKGSLEGWTAVGEAFQMQPTRGDNTAARNRESSNLQGKWWIGGYEKYNGKQGQPGDISGDQPTGTLTSQEFLIRQPYITFMIGAGNLPGEVGVRLLCEGQTKELATGVNSESMVPFSADVRDFQGKKARIQVFDNATGGWGHINVDNFRSADVPLPDTTLEFAFTGGISATAYPDIQYDQPLRPQFHFVSKKNWLNDPNGMVFDGKLYHLFFQHNPKATTWGNMTWGHASSSDMLHWKQHDHALLPYRVDRRDGTIFSGTAVIDHNNSLGKQVGNTKTICAFFTFAAQPKFYQALAYSTDGGNSFQYWNEGRAVVDNQGFDDGERDPKVFWHEATQRWVMALWVQSKPGRVRWFTSTNLVDWEFASDLMRDWAFECMDVVFLPLDGDKQNMKCVVYDASFDYEIGTFDGRQFHAESETLQIGNGNFYAAQTFNQAPDGRVVQIGWMRGGPDSSTLYGVPHNQQMAFPSELTLKSTPQGVRLFCWPIREIESLVSKTTSWAGVRLGPEVNALAELQDLDLLDLEIRLSPGTASQVVFDLPRVSLRYDAQKQALFHTGVDDAGNSKEVMTLEKLPLRNGQITLRLLVDRLSIEAYAFNGEFFAAHYIDALHGPRFFSIHSTEGHASLEDLQVRQLQSVWESDR